MGVLAVGATPTLSRPHKGAGTLTARVDLDAICLSRTR